MPAAVDRTYTDAAHAALMHYDSRLRYDSNESFKSFFKFNIAPVQCSRPEEEAFASCVRCYPSHFGLYSPHLLPKGCAYLEFRMNTREPKRKQFHLHEKPILVICVREIRQLVATGGRLLRFRFGMQH